MLLFSPLPNWVVTYHFPFYYLSNLRPNQLDSIKVPLPGIIIGSSSYPMVPVPMIRMLSNASNILEHFFLRHIQSSHVGELVRLSVLEWPYGKIVTICCEGRGAQGVFYARPVVGRIA